MKRKLLGVIVATGISAASCSAERGEATATSSEAFQAWAKGNISQVLRVNAGETTVRNACALTVVIPGPTPLAFVNNATGDEIGWTGSAISGSGFTVNDCSGGYPCEVTARWVDTAANGTSLGCDVIADDGTGQLVGTSTGTSLFVDAAPAATVIYNQDAKLDGSNRVAASCTLRYNLATTAQVLSFQVHRDGTPEVTLGARTTVTNDLNPGTPFDASNDWPAAGPVVSFGRIWLGAEGLPPLGITRLKHETKRKDQVLEGEAIQCVGTFQTGIGGAGVDVFDVNVTTAPVGNGISLTTDPTAWTCGGGFGVADGCQCDCGIIDPDCGTPCVPLDVTLDPAGSGTGSVAADIGGISCGVDCSENYGPNTLVTLTATQDAGSAFTGWSGGGCTGTGDCVVTMDGAKAVTARFDAMYTLTVSTTGSLAVGTVSGPGIDCGFDCTETYVDGTEITLTATGIFFTGWTAGPCNGSGSTICTFNITGDTTATASFL